MLLYGLSKLEFDYWSIVRTQTQDWTGVLITTKDGKVIPCCATLLPLSECGCPDRDVDSVQDHVNENGTSRSIKLSYGSDVMSIWMPLSEQSIDPTVVIPQSVFES